MNENNGNGRLRWVYVACGVAIALSASSALLWVIGESPTTAARRIEAVDDLKRDMCAINASLGELRTAVESLGGRR